MTLAVALSAGILAGEAAAPKFTRKPAVTRAGEKTVISFAVDRETDVAVYIGRDGKYMRTLMPFPANLPAEKFKALGAFSDAEGNPVPRIYNLQQLSSKVLRIGLKAGAAVGACDGRPSAAGPSFFEGCTAAAGVSFIA